MQPTGSVDITETQVVLARATSLQLIRFRWAATPKVLETMSSYTHYWTNKTCDESTAFEGHRRPLDHAAGSQFLRNGVRVGDNIYVVTVRKGRLFLIARFTVGKITKSDVEARRYLDYEPWSAPDHLHAEPGSGTVCNFDREVPLDRVRQLRFETKARIREPVFKDNSRLDTQTMRGVRKLTAISAKILEALL